ncbi:MULTISPECIES: hypothetical protein [Thermomonospora]|uniref:Uncharacterized protein n=1 Tax=Thermomonospora cellulosilytica TaxID=1411118 RepID=A0A7W3MZ85_9ACTN|nr:MULTISPECIES: hypothetical protein [Thermomonospora]MBA9004616.1 hypothetical protein [Thermomonospora cellulosilytica]
MSCPVLYCSACGGDRPFERPVCPDGHGAECPELACTECGMAIIVGAAPPALCDPVPVRGRAA